MIYPTIEQWVEAKRKEFVSFANRNNPFIGQIFYEMINKNSFKIIRVSDNKTLFETHTYQRAYNKAKKFKCEVIIK